MNETLFPPAQIGTPLTPTAIKALLLGSGELGKEVAIELQRFGVEVIAVDRYENAPAMQVAQRSHVVDMLDAARLRRVLDLERPQLIIPEIEAIATEVLVELEKEEPWPVRVVPTALATRLTMDREGIRRLASEELGLPTSPYQFVDTPQEMAQAANEIGFPCVVKPVMSSSGKGQSTVWSHADVLPAWEKAQRDARRTQGDPQRCIVEGFVEFGDEITVLTVRHSGGTLFFDPIHHTQKKGDYAESWQSPPGESELAEGTLSAAQDIARVVTEALGGYGVFGVEMFLVGDEVIFSEVSPRPHDTGLVTLGSSDISEFAAHARAVLGLPVQQVTRLPGSAASFPIKAKGAGIPVFRGVEQALATDPSVQIRLFGKPYVEGERRVAVVIARAPTVAEARTRAARAAAEIQVDLK